MQAQPEKLGAPAAPTANDAENTAEDAQGLRERVDNLSRLMEVTTLVSSSLDLDEVMNRVMGLAKDVMDAEAASIMIWNDELQCLEFKIAVGGAGVEKLKTIRIKKGQGIAGTVAETGQPLVVADVRSDPRFFQDADKQTGFVTKSILAAPLTVKNKVIGVSEVLNHSSGRPFTDLDLDLFVSFCRQVAIAVENARLHESEVKRLLMDQQMAMAASIQKSFLSHELPKDGEGRFEVGAFSKSAQAVGGDLFCVNRLPGNRLALALGDVSGKGIPAALYMARMISEFRLLSVRDTSVRDVVQELNRTMSEDSMRGMFVTFSYGMLDLKTGELQIVNAGHLPLIRIGVDGSLQMIGLASGPPLGLLPNVRYQSETVRLKPGDRLLFYSDGIVEARSAGGEEFGEERLREMAARTEGGAERLLQEILRDVDDFSRGTPQADDMTVVAASWAGDGK